MSSVEAKLRIKGKIFGILVDSDKAIALKQGKPVSVNEAVLSEEIYTDIKKGLRASQSDIKEAFGTEDFYTAAAKIIKSGEVQIPAEYREKQRDEKIKQVIDFLSRNAIDPQTGRPHTAGRIESALKEAGVNIDNRAIEEQIPSILDKLRPIIPIKVETKRLKITVPAVYTGRVYSLLKDFKESEEWLNNGDLSSIIKLPAGMQMDFYDKLNSITHGAAIAQEMKNE